MKIEHQPKLMIIPMIDIIFFLLVFFMMSMLTMVVQKSVPIQLPQAATSKVNLDKVLPITVTADGAIYLEQERIPEGQLKVRLDAEKSKNPEMAIIVRGDAGVNYGRVVSVIDTAKKSGIQKVSIAAEER
ncbi:biopolymer transporter ExbD [Veillonella sp.]|uniref:ExbD/TolR family protein n=1 Tax=Veillonella sp. TaxID=1926307 RepID=UPI0025F7AD7F|nr:biopolymer transporter ExbD [Veillonella sp.]